MFWTSVLSFFVSNKEKFKLGLGILVTLACLICAIVFWFKCESLSEKNQELQTALDAATSKIKILDTQIALKETETSDINELLNKCYKRQLKTEKYMQDIDNTFNANADSPVLPQGEENERITEGQNQAGLDFVNDFYRKSRDQLKRATNSLPAQTTKK